MSRWADLFGALSDGHDKADPTDTTKKEGVLSVVSPASRPCQTRQRISGKKVLSIVSAVSVPLPQEGALMR